MEFARDESREGHPERDPSGDFVASASRSLASNAISAEQADAGSHAPRLATGNAGDHKLVHALLRAANQAPSYEEFISWLDEPTYEPIDRLLVKLGNQIVAHVQVLDRIAWFGGVKLPVGGVQDLATLPEYREAGYERLLLASAEQNMRESQAVVAFVRTDRPEVFRSCGWMDVCSQRCTQASVNDLLARLSSLEVPSSRRRRRLKIRLWRHVELDALRYVYRSSAAGAWGAIDRSEPYWRWLVGRKAYEELIVAVHGKDQWEELARPPRIVGYAVTRGSQVVELFTLPGFARAAWPLLARACRDAIEQNHRSLSLLIPPNHPLHELMLSASGSWCSNGRTTAGTLMIKLLDPARWIESIYPVLLRRAKAAGVKRPCHTVFAAGRRKYRFDLTRRSSRLVREDAEAADVRCSPEFLAALLVGNLEVAAAQEAGQLDACDGATAERLAMLFPPVAFWQSQFDLLRI